MKNKSIISYTLFSIALILPGIPNVFAAVIPSENVIQQEQSRYNTQKLLELVDSGEVQEKLISLGVSPENAKARIASMTNEELASFHTQLNDMPAAAGVGGTIVTVLVVLAVLDVLGVTDVYSFIRPIN
jgi:hypothetical protein